MCCYIRLIFANEGFEKKKVAIPRMMVFRLFFWGDYYLLQALDAGGAGVGVHPAVPEHTRPAALRAGLSSLAQGLPPPLPLAHRGSHRFRLYTVCAARWNWLPSK